MIFARALGEFGTTLMLAGNIPCKTQTMPLAIYFATEAGKMNEALIWVVVLITIAKASENPETAPNFLEFLLSPAAKNIFIRYGFTIR